MNSYQSAQATAKQKSSFILVVSAVLLATNLFNICVFGSENTFASNLFREDGLFESLSAVFYLVAAGVFFRGFWGQSPPRRFWCLFFAILFFLVAGEEISWGQRIIGITTPESLNSINVQGEFNLHNINGIHQNVRLLGVLFITAFCFFIPISNYFSKPLQSFYQKLGVPIFPLSAMACVACVMVFMVVPRLFNMPDDQMFLFDEAGEFLLSFCWIPFAFHNT